MLRHLFAPDGDLALRTLARGKPLLAFDFDGTLAPIVPRPDDARVPIALTRRLVRLAGRRPVAVVTGRAVADVLPRLGFEPTFVVGNHGAEDPGHPPIGTEAMAVLRERLADTAPLLREAGVMVEDKQHSVALHYRLARDRDRARAQIEAVLEGAPPELRVFGGKCVVNVVATAAPDKADAVFSLVERSGSDSALFVGDDVNDEVVFRRAPDHWLTLRVGREDLNSKARFVLDGPGEVAQLLDRLLALLP